MFPYYLAMGMTYDQFWNEDVWLVKHYRKAWKLKQQLREHELWLQGAYVYEAVARLYPLFNPFVKKGTKPEPYIGEPYGVFGKSTEKKREEEKKQTSKGREYMEAFAASFNKRFEEKGGEKDGK